MRRLFFGLSVDPDVSQPMLRGVRATLDGSGPFAVYGPEDLHVTLCFLGEVDDERVQRLLSAAGVEFRALHAPELSVGGCGDAFPTRETPRALVSCVSEVTETVGRLAALRNRALQVGLTCGWRPTRVERERGFRPHVTLARPRAGAAVPEDFWDLGRERSWVPADVELFESRPERGDGEPRYRTVASWPLAVGPG
ncbi:MAG: RNA 2',3'-cyclic phosphodiesterase [Planctomycetota bacterium]